MTSYFIQFRPETLKSQEKLRGEYARNNQLSFPNHFQFDGEHKMNGEKDLIMKLGSQIFLFVVIITYQALQDPIAFDISENLKLDFLSNVVRSQ